MADRVVPGPLRYGRGFNTGMGGVNLLSGRQLDWDNRAYVLDLHEDYLKAATLPPKMRTVERSGQDIAELTFEDYLQECMRTLEWRIDQLPRSAIREGLTKEVIGTNVALAKTALQAIQWFLSMPLYKRTFMLNENRLSSDPRNPREIAQKVARDLKRWEKGARMPQLDLRQMRQFLREAAGATGMVEARG